MYNAPRRPYYNRSDNMPQSANTDDSVSIDNRRFWKLIKQLRRRQEDSEETKAKPAKSGQ
ncbi:MAG: hypothetical protein Phog2KO_39060 [Phototrophicaceae bacterium]